jgi:hypothetical protein
MTLFFGQINLVLLALVVGDFALPDRIKGKGIGIGLAAGIKLTPLIFIPYLLFTRRVKAAAVSALTFAVTVGSGFALLPHASAVYWGGKITQPGSKPFHLDNQSLNGLILRLTHAGPDAHAYWLVAAVVVGTAGLATSILASRRGHELLGLVACAATGLLVSPVTWSHHYVYVVPALVLAAYGPRRLGYRILGAALVVGLFGWWPVPIGNQGGYDPKAPLLPRGLLLLAPNRGNNRAAVEFTWRGLELIVGNYYVLTLLVFIAATACALVLTRRLRPERAVGPRARCRVGGTPPASPGRAISFLNGRHCAHLAVRGAGSCRSVRAHGEDLSGELAGLEQGADAVALLGGGRQLGRMAEAALQLLLDGGRAVLPARRGGRKVRGIGRGQHLQVRVAQQRAQLAAVREVVALRRIRQRPGGRKVDQQADAPGRTHRTAQFTEHGELGTAAARGAQDAQAPGQAGGGVGQRQGGRVGLDDRRAEKPGRGAAGAVLGFDQDGLDAGLPGRVGGRAADAGPDVDHQVARGRRQPRQQPVQGGGLPAAAAGRGDEVLGAQVRGHLRGPLRHGAELGRHRVIDVTGHDRALPGYAAPIPL